MGLFLLPSQVVSFLLWCSLFSLVFVTCVSKKNSNRPLESLEHLEILNPSSVESLRLSKTLSVVYYFTSEATPSRARFLEAFEASAGFMKIYNINLVVVNCIESSVILDECKGTNIIATYQNGVELIKLDIDTMFDVNSIMANSLQLLMLREVPIIESQSDREALQATLLGKQDLIFFYTRAIGTMEHRFFLETAYTYQDQYKFAVSTRLEATVGLSDEENLKPDNKYAMWTLHCSKSAPQPSGSSACRSALYRGAFSLHAFDIYMGRLSKNNLLYAEEDCNISIIEELADYPIIYIYTNSEMKKHSDDISHSLSFDVKGFAIVIVIDVDHEACRQMATTQGFEGHVPGVAIAVPDGNFTFMEKQDQLSLSEIMHFLINVATVPTEFGEEIVNATDRPLTWKPKYDELAAVDVQDDEVAKAVFKLDREIPDLTHVPAVLKATFQDVIQNAKLKVVLYYFPYDAVSMAFLSDFDEAGNILHSGKNTQNILARVNCYDATDLCARELIMTYPVVRIHRKNTPYLAYEGPLDTDSIVKAVGLLIHEFPLKLQEEEELNRFIKGEFPPLMTGLTTSSVLFVADQEDKGSWTLFKNASRRLAPFVAMGEVNGHLVKSLTRRYSCPAPCVLSFHHSDTIQPVRSMSSHLTDVEVVISFVKQAMIPTMPELTAANFPILHSKKLPFVILFLNQSNPESSEVKTAFSEIASRDSFHESIFCWMNAQNQTMGMALLKEYTQDVTTPLIAVVNHIQAKVFTHQVVASGEMDQWLSTVFSGQEAPTKMLTEKKWSPPGPHYDFLKFIDDDLEAFEEEEGNAGFKAGSEHEREVLKKLVDVDQAPSGDDGHAAEATDQDGKEMSHKHVEL